MHEATRCAALLGALLALLPASVFPQGSATDLHQREGGINAADIGIFASGDESERSSTMKALLFLVRYYPRPASGLHLKGGLDFDSLARLESRATGCLPPA